MLADCTGFAVFVAGSGPFSIAARHKEPIISERVIQATQIVERCLISHHQGQGKGFFAPDSTIVLL